MFAGHRSSPAAGALKLVGVDFTVSNAGDAGPGTLRDAILAADRLTNRAHIAVNVKRIAIESALPALINPHGVMIDAEPGFGLIDAAHQIKGAVLQINSPASALHGISIVNAHDFGIVLNAPGVEMDGVNISNSRVGIFLGAAAKGAAIRTSVFEHDETAITAESGVRDVSIVSSIFRGSSKAGFWFVGDVDKDGDPPQERVRIIDSVFERNAAGVVLANRPVLVQKCRFIANEQSAVLVLGGAARVEDSEIQGNVGTAISVTAGRQVTLARNTLSGNRLTAIMVRDSQVTIDHNTLTDNGSGVVSIASDHSDGTLIRDNVITKTGADAITVIGGSPRLQRNQATGNRGAGLRILNLVSTGGELKASPQLDANVFRGNVTDQPPPAVYKLAGTLPR
jgi:parallel beta-helix repeat protein